MNTDFTDARVGDKVYYYPKGEGVITHIYQTSPRPAPITVYVGNNYYFFRMDGKVHEHDTHQSLFWSKPDIIAPPMPVRKKTITIMGVELPVPETEDPQEWSMYYMPSVDAHELIAVSIWDFDEESTTNSHLWCLANGSVFLTAAAAAAHAKFWIEQTKKAMEKLNG